MSDIGGIGNLGNDPFASSFRRQAEGLDVVEQQRVAQQQANDRAREALGLSGPGNRSPREQEREEVRERAGPGIRREEVNREGDSPRLRQLSDETAVIDSTAVEQGARNSRQAETQRTVEQDEVQLSQEAQRRLSSENAPPPPGEALAAEPNDPLRIDTPSERQASELGDQIDRGSNETQAGRALGQVLDQFS